MDHHLAQVNVSRLLAPLDSPVLADFMAALDEVNAEADRAPGFVWRLQTEDGNATSVQAFGWDAAGSHGVIVNLTVWRDVESLAAYVFGGRHVQIMRRRREWFSRAAEATPALWWIPAGTLPTTDDAEARIRHLRAHGPTPEAFTFRTHFPPLEGAVAPSSDDWLCPA
ncbi:DUF3291 domain-containing protein [Blastococcus sp. SYSU DS0616]